MPDFGIFRGFGEKLIQGQTPTELGKIGSESFGYTGLLDAYPNAAAAYSLRLLRSAYTGSAIRVRRASDNAEQDIGFNGENLNTSALTSFCSGTNGFVKTWYDQSGNARNATQTTAANQPQIVNSGSVFLTNNKPILYFNDAPFLSYDGTFFANTKYSIFSANLRTSSKITNYLLGGDIGSDNRNLHLGHFNDTTYRFAQYGNDLNVNVSAFTTEQLFLLNALNSNTGKQIYFNNSLANSNANTVNLIDYLNATIGRYSENGTSYVFFQGKCSEIVIYASDKSSDLSGINTNINSFYSIY